MRTAWILCGIALAGCGGAEPSLSVADGPPVFAAPWKSLAPTGQPPKSSGSDPPPNSPSAGIEYHGGPIMTGTVNVYLIWYGDWSANTGTALLPTFIQNLSGSPYWAINSTYYDNTGTPGSTTLNIAGQTNDVGSQGTSLNMSSPAVISNIVFAALTSGTPLPVDTNGIYFVLPGTNVFDSSGGMCAAFCGWHTYMTVSNPSPHRLKYALVPDAGVSCPGSCAANFGGGTNTTVSPNSNVGVDAMASVLAHEATETITDPEINGWYHTTGSGEDGDLCAWTFGTLSTAANGSKYNLTLGGTNYLVQRNQSVAAGGCAMSYP